MLVDLFRPGEWFPAGTFSNSNVAHLLIVPKPGTVHEMFRPQTAGNSVVRGRYISKPAAWTSIVFQVGTGEGTTPKFGAANAGLEATILTLNSDSLQSANTYFMPFIRLQANGTSAGNDVQCRLTMLLGFPVEEIRVLDAIAGLPWATGDNIADPKLGRVWRP